MIERASAVRSTAGAFAAGIAASLLMVSALPSVLVGVAPNRLIATKVEGGKVVRERPLCPYPQVATWSGSGSTDVAASFTCTLPRP